MLQVNIYQQSVHNSNAHQSKYPSNVQQSKNYKQSGALPSYHESQFNNGQSVHSTNMKQSNMQSAKGSNIPHSSLHPSQAQDINQKTSLIPSSVYDTKIMQSNMTQQSIKNSKNPQSYVHSSNVYMQSMKQSNASNIPNNTSSRQSAKQSIQSHK